MDATVSQLGLLLGYDSRDNIFSANRRIKADFEAKFGAEAIGSDDTFQKYKLASLFFWQWGRSSISASGSTTASREAMRRSSSFHSS